MEALDDKSIREKNWCCTGRDEQCRKRLIRSTGTKLGCCSNRFIMRWQGLIRFIKLDHDVVSFVSFLLGELKILVPEYIYIYLQLAYAPTPISTNNRLDG